MMAGFLDTMRMGFQGAYPELFTDQRKQVQADRDYAWGNAMQQARDQAGVLKMQGMDVKGLGIPGIGDAMARENLGMGSGLGNLLTQRLPANLAAQEQARLDALEARNRSIIQNLNAGYLRGMKAPVAVSDAVQQAGNALNLGSSLGALAAVIKLAKILDPESVVREGEVTTVEGGIGVAARLIRWFNQLFGEGFSPEGAQQMADIINSVAAPVLARGGQIESEYRKAAELAGVPFEEVLLGAGFTDPGPVTLRDRSQPGPDGTYDLTTGGN